MPVTVYTIWDRPVKHETTNADIAEQAARDGKRVTAVTVAE